MPGHAGAPADEPLVSIVIPCYAQAAFLSEAIASALDTTVRVEVIVVDDGTPDGAIREVMRGWPDVRFLARPHDGVSAARNAGVAASRGRYVTFLDADDHLLPGALEAGLACIERHPDAGFAHGRYRFIREDGSPAGMPAAQWPEPGDYLQLVRSNYIGMLATVLFRTESVRAAGGFRYGLAFSEDYELILRVARLYPIARHDGMVAEYRRYASSVSADAARMLQHVLEVLERERALATPGGETRRAFDEGARFFRLFYGVRLVRQIFREGLLRGRFRVAQGWASDLIRLVGPSLTLTSLPPSVTVAAVRKTWWIVRGWWERRAVRSAGRSTAPWSA